MSSSKTAQNDLKLHALFGLRSLQHEKAALTKPAVVRRLPAVHEVPVEESTGVPGSKSGSISMVTTSI